MNSKNKLLLHREQMFDLIKNIRLVRNRVRSSVFDAKLYNEINGNDAALESLVGHDVAFETLDPAEQLKLRREVLSKLTDSENEAFDKLRDIATEYFQNIDKVVDATESIEAWQQPRRISDPSVFDATDGAYTKAGLEDVESALKKFEDFTTAVSPMMSRILAEQDVPKLPDEAAIVHESIPSGDVEPTPVPSTVVQDPAEQKETTIDIPPQPETIEKVREGDENDNALEEVVNACECNLSLGRCADHFISRGVNLKELGYGTPEAAINAVRKVEALEASVGRSFKAFRDILPCRTCVVEDLYRGTPKFYQAMDALTKLCDKAVVIYDRLGQTKASLTKALQQVH